MKRWSDLPEATQQESFRVINSIWIIDSHCCPSAELFLFWNTALTYNNCWHDKHNVAIFSWDCLCLCLDYIKTSVLFKLQSIFLGWPKISNQLSNISCISFTIGSISYIAIAYVQKRSYCSLRMRENITALYCFKREWQKSRGNGYFHSYQTEFQELAWDAPSDNASLPYNS